MGRGAQLTVRAIVVLVIGVGLLYALQDRSARESGAAPDSASPAMGTPFTVDGFTITLESLRPIAEVNLGSEPLPGTELWVLLITAVNDTGREADVGTGFRLEAEGGAIEGAELLSSLDDKFGATLAPGGRDRGYLTFSLPVSTPPVAVLVNPAGTEIRVPIDSAPWPSPTP